jgi:hypothetical protein
VDVQLVFVIKCDLVYEDLEGVFSFQDMHVEDIEWFSKIMSGALI